jgi:hypothetical protein
MRAPYRAVDIATLNGVLTSVQQLRDAVDLENEMAKETKKVAGIDTGWFGSMRFAPSHLGNPPKMIRYGSAHV